MRRIKPLVLAIAVVATLTATRSFAQGVGPEPTGGGLIAPPPNTDATAPQANGRVRISAGWFAIQTARLMFARMGIVTLPVADRMFWEARKVRVRAPR